MDVSIVIPTKNGGHLFEKVLDAVFKQKTEYEYEVICVDSGSKDGTLDVIRKYPCRLFQIEPSEFGHGKTRNYGASKGNGTYIIFITQDALPATDTWLQNFIDAMKMDPEIVGGFGIHYPYPDKHNFNIVMPVQTEIGGDMRNRDIVNIAVSKMIVFEKRSRIVFHGKRILRI